MILPGATDVQGEPAAGQTGIGVRERPGAHLEGAPGLEKHLGSESAPRSQPFTAAFPARKVTEFLCSRTGNFALPNYRTFISYFIVSYLSLSPKFFLMIDDCAFYLYTSEPVDDSVTIWRRYPNHSKPGREETKPVMANL